MTPARPPAAGGPQGAPWTLLALAGVVLLLITWLGVNTTSGVAVGVLAALFLVFLFRHLAFAASALSTARDDMRSREQLRLRVPAARDRDGAVPQRGARASRAWSSLPRCARLPGGSARAHRDRRRLRRRAPARSSTSSRAATAACTCIHRPPGAGGGKSGALNTALATATGDVIVVFDADHKPRADVLRRLVRHFADPDVGAVQGRCIVRNSEDSSLAKTIAVDYYCGYLVNEYGRQSLYDLPAYGGANCAVRGELDLREFGGWNPETVTEDTDLTLRLVLAGQRVRFDVTAIDTEESVSTFRRFWRQRYRWARGHQQAWREYRARGLARTEPVVLAEDRDDDVPARVPRAGRVRARAGR